MLVRIQLLTILCCFSVFMNYAQTNSFGQPNAQKYFSLADSLHKADRYAESQIQIDKYLQIQKQQNNTSEVIRGNYIKIANLMGMGDYKTSFKLCKNTIALNYQTVNDSSYTDILLTKLGILNYRLGYFQEALSNFRESLEIQEIIYDSNKEKISIGHNNLGIMCKNMGMYGQSLKHFQKAIFFQKSSGLDDELALAKYYNNLGDLYVNLGDYRLAIDYLMQSLRIYEVYPEKNQFNLSVVCLSLGTAYSKIGYHEMVTKYTDQAYRIASRLVSKDHPYIVFLKRNYAAILMDIGKFQEARSLYEDGLEFMIKNNPGNIPELCWYHSKIGISYLIESPKKALAEFEHAITMYEEKVGHRNTTITHYYYLAAEACWKLGDFTKALDYIEKCITSNLIDDGKSIAIRDRYLQLQGLSLKGKTLLSRRFENDLPSAANIFQKCDQLISKLRNNHQKYEDKIKLGEMAREIYENAIEVSCLLFQNSKDEKSFSQGFHYSERSKASVLLDSYRKLAGQKSLTKVEDSLLITHHKMEVEISELEAILSNERINSPSNPAAIIEIQGKIIELRHSKDSINSEVNRLLSDDLISALESKTPQLASIRKNLLGSDDALIEYFLTESTVYLFFINQNSIDLKAISIDSVFHHNLQKLKSLLGNPRIKENTDENFDLFCHTSHSLYRKLIAPVSSLIKGKNVMIVPGDELALIPFEVLTTDTTNFSEGQYHKLSFWLKDQNITYSNSAALLMASKEKEAIQSEKISVLAFAPSFDIIENKTEYSRDTVRGTLGNLGWTAKEVAGIKDYFEVVPFFGEDASESTFKKEATEHTVIHIASHGMVDDVNPLFSKIAFALNQSDTTDDGFLHTFELQSLNLQASMAVLSACNTGYGKIQKGEGVRSLGYAFSYAGVPSVVMSHWQVDDKSTYLIMNHFYKYLAAGYKKSEALREAKLQLLTNENIGYENPYYWSAFVTYGNDDPLQSHAANHYWLFLGLISMIFGGLIWQWKRLQKVKAR